jgi:predicted homoserine dehydrogenase-like protein
MLDELKYREKEGQPIRVGLIGAGAMGLGVAWQIGRTPGMEISFIADLNIEAARKGEEVYGKATRVTTDGLRALKDERIPCDVLVESSNSIAPAGEYCLAAIERKSHVVLMNAEVDLMLGRLLQAEAVKQGVVVTSDAGDQHGVLMRMMEEVEMWGFDLVQAGNIKGFLNRYATVESLQQEARKRNLNPVQCCAYTDGSKLNIEMALVSNGTGMTPFVPGMQGPACKRVEEVVKAFDFDAYDGIGRVDYVLGAEPGGGVYVVGRCDDEFQKHYLWYYKLVSNHPYYLLYRPYHLCHLETPRAVALAALWGKPVLTHKFGRVSDVYAYAKRDLAPGAVVNHGIGSDEVYGIIECAPEADGAGQVPQGILEASESGAKPILKRALRKDEALCWDDVELPDSMLLNLFERQQQLFSVPVPARYQKVAAA